MRLQGKVAIITGAASGMGRVTAQVFAEEGAQVLAVDRDPRVLLGESERRAGMQADVTCEADMEAMVQRVVARFGALDILFANAGVEVPGAVTGLTLEQWQMVMDINVRGVFLSCKYAVREMLARGGGSIVINSSINASRGNYNLAAYCASKGAIDALARAMALDYAASNIRVNCVCPGTIEDTGMVGSKLEASADERALRAALVAKHPMGRLGRAEEVARAVAFLASGEASFITGASLPVDGGRAIR